MASTKEKRLLSLTVGAMVDDQSQFWHMSFGVADIAMNYRFAKV